MPTWRYSLGPEEKAAREHVDVLLAAAEIGDLFVRPAGTDDRRLWLIVREANHGKAIWEINPDGDDWRYAARYEVPGDIVALPRDGQRRG